MNTIATIPANRRVSLPYPPEIQAALQQTAEEFEREARELIAVRLYETGRLSSGLAAKIVGVPRHEFWLILGKYKVSPFGTTPEELEQDVANARAASNRR